MAQPSHQNSAGKLYPELAEVSALSVASLLGLLAVPGLQGGRTEAETCRLHGRAWVERTRRLSGSLAGLGSSRFHAVLGTRLNAGDDHSLRVALMAWGLELSGGLYKLCGWLPPCSLI